MSWVEKLTDYDSPESLGSWFRKRRSNHLRSLLAECFDKFGQVNVIDIGGRPSYWNIFPRSLFDELQICILLVNYESEIPSNQLDNRFTQLHADACDLSMFGDKTFHLAHSNSVIEHVGNWQRVQQFASETQRVANACYMQTPNFGFPIEPHYMMPLFHWLPEQARARVLQKTKIGHYAREHNIVKAVETVQSIQLLNLTMVQGLFPEARIEKEIFCGITKSLIAIQDLQAEPSV